MIVHNLPYAAAPFVNRVSEIGEVTHRLHHADCRLLTLVGPGGIGKTRLAMRVAATCAEQFDDGVYFVPLQPLNSPEFIVSAIIDVVSSLSRQGGDLKQQLLQNLREKVLLLVLYIVLGTLALKRARTRSARAWCYAAALAVFLFIVSVARAHSPLGFLGYFTHG